MSEGEGEATTRWTPRLIEVALAALEKERNKMAVEVNKDGVILVADRPFKDKTNAELARSYADYSFHLGEIAGVKRAAEYLRKIAGELYADGLDDEARAARTFANSVKRKEEELRAEYEKNIVGKMAKVQGEITWRGTLADDLREKRGEGK